MCGQNEWWGSRLYDIENTVVMKIISHSLMCRFCWPSVQMRSGHLWCLSWAELLCSLAALQTLGSWTNGLTGTCPHSSLSLPDKSHPCWNVSHRIWNSLDCCVIYHDKQINQKPHWEEMWATFRKNGDEKFGLFSLLLTSQKSVIHGDSLAFWSPVLNKKSWRGSNKTWWGTLLWDPLKSGVIFGQRFQGFLTLFFLKDSTCNLGMNSKNDQWRYECI